MLSCSPVEARPLHPLGDHDRVAHQRVDDGGRSHGVEAARHHRRLLVSEGTGQDGAGQGARVSSRQDEAGEERNPI